MFLKNVHRYLGVVLALIMLSISVTGVLLLWKKEYLWLTIADARAEVKPQTLPAAIERIEQNYADGEVTFIQLYSEDLSLHKVFLRDRRYAWHKQNGEPIQVWSGNERLEDWLLDLHHRFLLGNTIGLNVAGLGGLLLIPLLIVGFIIWWPRRRALKIGILPKSKDRAALMRSHGNTGAVFILPIFLLTLTGVILVYPIESRSVFLNGFGDDAPPKFYIKNYIYSGTFPRWSELIAIARRQFPESDIRSVQPSSAKQQVRVINVQQAEEWHRLGRTSLRFDRSLISQDSSIPNSSGVVTINDALEQPLKKRVLAFSYPLHTAKLGLPYRLFLTLVGLAFALLCALGLSSFSKGLFIKTKRPI